jgi:DNA-binding response OmpR family regulator
MARILLVEDEDSLARSLQVGLGDEFYLVDRAANGEEALWHARTDLHEAMILDLRIPPPDGLQVCRKLRGEGRTLPILILTACDAPHEVVEGLDAGADDYLTKPFSFEVLLARLRALLRRGSRGQGSSLQISDLRIETAAHRVFRGKREISLTKMEYVLLEHLALNQGSVQGRDRLTALLWEDEIGPESNSLDVLVSSLRKKIDPECKTRLIQTRRGLGYILIGEQESA